jgi:hypothetical protein
VLIYCCRRRRRCDFFPCFGIDVDFTVLFMVACPLRSDRVQFYAKKQNVFPPLSSLSDLPLLKNTFMFETPCISLILSSVFSKLHFLLEKNI